MNNDALKHPERMTQPMLDAIADLPDLKAEYELCRNGEDQASKAGKISLPSASVQGTPVTHASRRDMHAMKEYWHMRRQAIENFLNPRLWREWEEQHYQRKEATIQRTIFGVGFTPKQAAALDADDPAPRWDLNPPQREEYDDDHAYALGLRDYCDRLLAAKETIR